MKIKFDLSGDNRPYIESIADYETSMFKNQYEQSFSLIDSYLRGIDLSKSDPSALAGSIEKNNNIFAFDGNRGTGKTSCMLSVANILLDKDHREVTNGLKYVSEKMFYTISMIDPSFFDKSHNILVLFIAKLYKSFEDFEENPLNAGIINNSYRPKLVTKFVEVQQQLRSMFGKENPADGLEYVVNLSASVQIRDDIRELVALFLKYIGKEDAVLLLMVDDIDIDDENAEEMAEQLRKYFMQPNIVVLLSLKIDQLTGILQRSLVEKYGNEADSKREEITERVERYLAKLIPAHQRIYMPSVEDYINAIPEIKDAKQWGVELVDGIRLKQLVPELIFLKTRYLFYNTSNQVSYIVPENLRDLRQILKLLYQMPDYANGDESEIHYYNKEAFKKYFFNDWCDLNLSSKTKSIAKKLLSIKKISEYNYQVVKLLYEYIEDRWKNREITGEIGCILDPQNNPYNVSYGDVLALIRAIERFMVDEDTRKLMFFIRSVYSIQLYRAYDLISSSNEFKQEVDAENVLIQKPEHLYIRSDYESLIGGCLFNHELDPLLPNDYTNFSIAIEDLENLFKTCNDNWVEAESHNLIRFAEFVMLGIHYDSMKAILTSEKSSYRRSLELCYDDLEQCESLVFDMGSVLFNVTRIEDCFSRFIVYPEGAKFVGQLEILRQQHKDPLFNDFQTITSKHRNKHNKQPGERWLSFCCFRNTEIIEDFLDTVKGLIPPQSSIFESFSTFFKEAARYSIMSYDRYDDSNSGKENIPYTINFSFYECVANIFTSGDKTLRDTFKKIFVKNKELENPFATMQE